MCYTLNATIGVSPNFGVEGNTTIALGNGQVSWEVGMTKVHTQGLQAFQVKWSVHEQYNDNKRSTVSVKGGLIENSHGVVFDPKTNMFSKFITVHGQAYKVKIWLDTH